jgi:secreted trypsin-like serine protease
MRVSRSLGLQAAIVIAFVTQASCAEILEEAALDANEQQDVVGQNDEVTTETIGESRLPVTRAAISSVPSSAVRLIFLDVIGNCTGVVLSRHWLLTAAHCVWDAVAQNGVFEANRLTIRWGQNGTGTGIDIYNNGAAAYWIHPDYSGDEGDLGDDLALVRLYGSGMTVVSRALIMGETDRCFAFSASSIGPPKAAGYGLGTNPDGSGSCSSGQSGWKRSGTFFIPPNCFGTQPPWSPRSPFVRELIFDAQDREICGGDSGGPIYFQYDGRVIVAGLIAGTSTLLGADTHHGPSIRRKLDWILDKSIDVGIPLDCQPGYSDVGPDWWLCDE